MARITARENTKIEHKDTHTDARGTIDEIWHNTDHIGTLFSTNSGYARGGEWNAEAKNLLMLKGAGFWVLIREGKTEFVEQKRGELFRIPERVPHLFVSLQDSIFLRQFDLGSNSTATYDPGLREYATGEADLQRLINEYRRRKSSGLLRYCKDEK